MPDPNELTHRSAREKGLLPEDNSEIRLVPDAVRDVWQRTAGEPSEREQQAWAEFLRTPEGRAWLRERSKVHRAR